MLLASYTEKIDQATGYSLAFAAGGLLIGAITALRSIKVQEKRDNLLKDNLEWADTGFSAILLASFVMFFVVQAFKIPSGSMRMTFVEGDHLFVNKFIYGVPVPFTTKKVVPFRPVKQRDIVIFRFPAKSEDSPHFGKDFIKRVIATEGQTVFVKDKNVFVNGVQLVEPYKQHVDPILFPGSPWGEGEFQRRWESGEFASLGGNDIRDNFGPVKVPAGSVFVMGDNRDRSFDSRFWGPLRVDAIKGKAWVLYWPLNRFHLVR
jgi:signal peptidase I